MRALRATEEATAHNTGLILNLAVNYGSRAEILDVVRHVASDVAAGTLAPDAINETVFNRYLYTREVPDPDLLIRTSGELRLSNFLLWQMAYTEFWFTDLYWPDGQKALVEASEGLPETGSAVSGPASPDGSLAAPPRSPDPGRS